MREIEFRGKSSDDGSWISGYYLPDMLEMIGKDIDWAFIKTYDLLDKKTSTFEVLKETIGQYTGLKDKNGKKIYEGDIIVLSNDSVKGEIFFNEKISAFQLRYLGELGELFEPKFLGEWITCYSIIGNIHDNPELLQN